jgi:methionine synthase II (cobalamin-independent)
MTEKYPNLRDFVYTWVLNRTLRSYDELVDDITLDLFEEIRDLYASKRKFVDNDDFQYQIKEVLQRLVLPEAMWDTENSIDACDEWTDKIIDQCVAAYNLDAEAYKVTEEKASQ